MSGSKRVLQREKQQLHSLHNNHVLKFITLTLHAHFTQTLPVSVLLYKTTTKDQMDGKITVPSL